MELNIITGVIALLFFLPILFGLLEPFSRAKIRHSFGSLFDNIEFLFGLLLSIYLTKKVFFENSTGTFKQIYEWIPVNIRAALYGKDILTYIVAVPILLSLVLLVLRILTNPIYGMIIEPLSDLIYAAVSSMNGFFRRILGALWSIPKSVFIVLVFALVLNFYSYYFSNPSLSRWMNESSVYQQLYKRALYPALNSNIAKRIPVLINDSFRKPIGRIDPGRPGNNGEVPEQFSKKGGSPNIIEYFNGVTLDEAIKSTPAIDEAARKIVGNEKDSRKKAQLIYRWISRNIQYDYEKAARVSRNPMGISSGSIDAFNTRKGICFDYSCLYISMCRAVGVKVRLVTGLGYSGVAWGDHAWNQAYWTEEKRWINVDTTFGTTGNYFDKQDFYVDHQYPEIQGEW